jgi:hypothetical protein
MSNTDTLTKTIIKWAATRSDEIVFVPTAGYYSFNIVSDAYEKGKEDKQNQLKETMRAKYFSNAQLAAEAIQSIVAELVKKDFSPLKLFLNLTVDGSMVLFSVKEDVYITENFINSAYSEAARLQLDYYNKGLDLQISFMNDSNEFNLGLLKSDGYGIAINLETDKTIY